MERSTRRALAFLLFVYPVLLSAEQQRQIADSSCGCGSAAAVAANEAGFQAHRQRCLDRASFEYDRALELASARRPTEEEKKLVFRFAPVVLATRREPFKLLDVVAIIHPSKPWIAYHLFWEDDIDFPEDNDPSDHEIVWVELDFKRQQIVSYYTYFHSRVLRAPTRAMTEILAHRGHPEVDVQWGKHGTMPLFWQPLTIVADEHDVESSYYPLNKPITLETYNRGIFKKLSTLGRRSQQSPLGKSWPRTFPGAWSDFVDFSNQIKSEQFLRRTNMIEVTCFANAVLNRHFLRYNFRAKVEWPEQLCSDESSVPR